MKNNMPSTRKTTHEPAAATGHAAPAEDAMSRDGRARAVVDAVERTALLQREMARRNEGLPDNRRIDMRIGVHVGDVVVEGEDCHGHAVNRASSLIPHIE